MKNAQWDSVHAKIEMVPCGNRQPYGHVWKRVRKITLSVQHEGVSATSSVFWDPATCGLQDTLDLMVEAIDRMLSKGK